MMTLNCVPGSLRCVELIRRKSLVTVREPSSRFVTLLNNFDLK
jgi:hypothetical protein